MNSSRHLLELILFIDGLNPIKISYNDEILFDDELCTNSSENQDIYFKGLRKWSDIREINPLIYSIDIEIVDFHHSIVRLKGEKILYKE